MVGSREFEQQKLFGWVKQTYLQFNTKHYEYDYASVHKYWNWSLDDSVY